MELPQLESVNIFNHIINDIQSVQTKYDSTVTSLNLKLRKAINDARRYMETIDSLQNEMDRMNNSNEKVYRKAEVLDEDNKRLARDLQVKDTTIENLQGQVALLTQQIEALENDKKEFTKVSHVIAMEKENAKLKLENSALQERIKLLKCSVEMNNPCEEHTNGADIEEEAKEDDETPEEEEEEVVEKKIKGVVYYVSVNPNSDNQFTLYIKNEDGSVGANVGHIEKKDNKNKVTWHTN